MRYPDESEIAMALDAINHDGATAPITMNLSVIAVKNPRIMAVINRMAEAAE